MGSCHGSMTVTATQPMGRSVKILLSALACAPDKGSEPEVGYRTLLAAASVHDVWLITDASNVSSLNAALADHPRRDRIHLHGVDFAMSQPGHGPRNVVEYQRHYDRWQRTIGRLAVSLDGEHDFDLVHHVTLASYWTRAGVAVVDKPFVWGPVGGGVEPPWRLLTELGPQGVVEDLLRFIGRRTIGRLPSTRRAPRRAVVALAQNAETARRLSTNGHVRVLCNAVAVDPSDLPPAAPPQPRVAFVGRLTGWKAPMLALRTLRYVTHREVELHFYGDGPERARLEAKAGRWGLTDRVVYHGWVPRRRLLDDLAHVAALLHPALHEEAGLSIAEALTMGVPVVALAHGGPREVARHWPAEASVLVDPAGPRQTAQALAAALDHLLGPQQPGGRTATPPDVSFGDSLLEAYGAALSSED